MRGLVKRYGDNLAVDHLDFDIEPGRIYGLLGPNGAGKSTTMNIMTGYLGATEGDVVINGHNILEEPEAAKRCIGYLPEIPPLYTDMTPLEYLRFAAELKGIESSRREKEVFKAIDRTSINDVRNRLISNLSKGYRQRVGLAQAILDTPDIIILDEPTVGLDPKQIIEIRELIRALAHKHTVILSSHILSEVQAVCDHILIISRGKLVAAGTPAELEEQLGTHAMDLTLKTSDLEAAKRVVASISGVTGVRAMLGQARGETDLSLTLRGGTDIREDIYASCVQSGIPLLMMKSADFSLEQIFLQLTMDGAAVQSPELQKKLHFGRNRNDVKSAKAAEAPAKAEAAGTPEAPEAAETPASEAPEITVSGAEAPAKDESEAKDE